MSEEWDFMEICNRNHDRVMREAQIQEAIDMANRPGERLRAKHKAELAAANKRARDAERISETLLNWVLVFIAIGLMASIAMSWLILKGLLPQ